MPFLDHLEELRWRILWSLLALAIGTAAGWYLLGRVDVLELLKRPIAPYLPGGRLVFTSPAEPFMLTLKIAFAVGWAQSYIRDGARREILFDLKTARRRLFEQSGKTPEFDLLAKSAANLFRKHTRQDVAAACWRVRNDDLDCPCRLRQSALVGKRN